MSETEPIDSSSSKPGDEAAIASGTLLIQLRSTQKAYRSSPKFVPLFAFGLQVVLLLAASVSILYGLLYLPSSVLSSVSHPAQIPWLTTQDSCEQSGRTWQQGRCFDYDHNPMF